MSYAPSPDNLLIGRGKVYFDIYENGQRTGEIPFGQVDSFGLTIQDELREKYETMTHASGLYNVVPVKRQVTLNLVGSEYNLDNLALANLGLRSVINQTAGTVTDETVTASAKLGRFYALTHRKVSNVVVTVGSATKVEGTDYTVDAVTGRIYIVPTGSITEGSTVVVDYSYAAATLQVIDGGKAKKIEAFVRYVGDPAAGPAYEVQVYKAMLTPNGELGLITDDFGQFTLTGKVLAAGPADSPFYRVISL